MGPFGSLLLTATWDDKTLRGVTYGVGWGLTLSSRDPCSKELLQGHRELNLVEQKTQ